MSLQFDKGFVGGEVVVEGGSNRSRNPRVTFGRAGVKIKSRCLLRPVESQKGQFSVQFRRELKEPSGHVKKWDLVLPLATALMGTSSFCLVKAPPTAPPHIETEEMADEFRR